DRATACRPRRPVPPAASGHIRPNPIVNKRPIKRNKRPGHFPSGTSDVRNAPPAPTSEVVATLAVGRYRSGRILTGSALHALRLRVGQRHNPCAPRHVPLKHPTRL